MTTQIMSLRTQVNRTQDQIARASEQVAIARQQLIEATHLLSHLSEQLSTMESQLVRQPTSLLSLPQELRDEILKYLLVQHYCVKLSPKFRSVYDYAKERYLALSEVNKQIRGDVVDVFFRNNRFHWSVCYPPRCIPEEHLRLIPQIYLDSGFYYVGMNISSEEAKLSLDHWGKKWTVPWREGKVSVQSLREPWWPVSESERRHHLRIVMEFQSLLTHGHGVNLRALDFMGRQLIPQWVTK